MSPVPRDYGEVTLQEQSRPSAASRIRSSQRSDINSGGGAGGNSGHKGGSDRRSPPTRADTPWPGEEALQELPQPVVEPPTPSSQNNDINFGETAGASSGNKGGSDRCLAYVSPITMRRACKETY
jgi:hypothetical protein